jgi:predicted RNA-binding Zn ribbon-like protein
VVDLPPGFQPAGRAPAPPPLDLVQDFVNTEIPVWAIDEIGTPAALAAWLGGRGLLSANARVDAEAFVRARALRSVLRELARRHTRGIGVDDELRTEFDEIAVATQLRFELGGAGEIRLEPDADGVTGALAEILRRVHEAQASGVWRRLKACPGPHCGWLFYDASRNASSRWCSMSICGNRTKTAAYRRRRRAR